MQQIGIDNLKDAVKTTVEFAEKVIECSKDGKINLFEKISLIGQGTAFVEFIGKASEVKQEFIDLDDQERAEIIELVKQEFDFEDERIELIIENSFAVALSLEALIRTIKND